ncbi:MAG: hypothetical protein L0Z62_15555 [Gemmataceae bacterium]|nr:hypothetical protein [Gemmataceae bacterium]
MTHRLLILLAGLLPAGLALAAQPGSDPALGKALARPILEPRRTLDDVRKFVASRVPTLPKFGTAAEWEKYATKLRADVLARVVYRGEATAWRDVPLKIEWLDVVEGGPGYRLKKVRYEAVPGLWIPALLYEPTRLTARVPAALCVMGHDGGGKEAGYQQIRCINLAKRGMLALNVEWFAFGQLKGSKYAHGSMNQLDLCGTSGLAPFYLSLKRGLDVLLSHPHADPTRVSVSGLSGGGWQTIYISALDTRVTLSNPVAGYSSFLTRLNHFKDLGDSEQTPCDMATVADYTHLTALLAPRPALLTYNSKDECCFESGYALPPLMEAAGPFYRLHGKGPALRSHVNHVPGTHNYEKENREAFYRMIGDHFFAGDKNFKSEEIPCADEVKKRMEVLVPLPEGNTDLNGLALALAKNLPRQAKLPDDRELAESWQKDQQAALRALVKAPDYSIKAVKLGEGEAGETKAVSWRLELDKDWQVPAVELTPPGAKRTALVVHDGGRKAAAAEVARLLKSGYRVLAVDPFYFGESRLPERDYLFALLVSAVGERPLGLQAGQVAAVARWAGREHGLPVTLVANGPRSSLFALVAAALEGKAIEEVRLTGSLGSLKEVIEQNRTVNQMPEVFCFGLLERFDIKQLVALVAPRPVHFTNASERARRELAGLEGWYERLGRKFDPLGK